MKLMMIFANDQRGAVSVDWVTLTAGILLLGTMVVYTIMNDSAGYLMDEFEDLNEQYSEDAVDMTSLSDQAGDQVDFGH